MRFCFWFFFFFFWVFHLLVQIYTIRYGSTSSRDHEISLMIMMVSYPIKQGKERGKKRSGAVG